MCGLTLKIRRLAGAELGQSFIETLIALFILGMVAVIFLGGLTIASKSVIVSQERVTAENLAKSQMEDIKNQDFKDGYHQYQKINIPSELADQGYNIEWPFERETIGDGLQKITVVVSRNGEEILELEGYKSDR